MYTAALIAFVILGGIIGVVIVVMPSFRVKKKPTEPMLIPLAEIAPIWTKHNEEMAVLSPEELEKDDPESGFDGMYAQKAPEKAQQPQDGDHPATTPVIVSSPAAVAAPSAVPSAVPAIPLGPIKQKETVPPEKPPEPRLATPPKPATIPVPQPMERVAAPAATSPQVQKKPGTTGLSLSALAEPLKSLWDDCIAPYSQVIKSQGAEEAIMTLLQLLEKHGHYPSVVIDNKDTESVDINTVRDNLVKVTLRDHTYAVCRYMMGNLKSTYKDFELSIPTVLISALAHDIGKIPEFRLTGVYNSKDHALVSAGKLSEMIGDNNPVWGKKAVRAVSSHHVTSSDDMTVMLKQSDRQARQAELAVYTRSYNIRPFSEWFDLKKYILDYIAPGVNVQQTSKWNAFSFKGTIYARPDWLYEQARKMCHAEKILDLNFVYESEKPSAIRMIVSALRKENMTPLLGEGYPGRKFEIRTSVDLRKTQPWYLTAFTIPDYVNRMEVESHKSGYTEIIDSVIPLS